MKLSELIRKGYKDFGLRQNHYTTVQKRSDYYCVCPYGAAYVACGRNVEDLEIMSLPLYTAVNTVDKYLNLDSEWVQIQTPMELLLKGHSSVIPIFNFVTIANDELKWSWERIADYLEKEGY